MKWKLNQKQMLWAAGAVLFLLLSIVVIRSCSTKIYLETTTFVIGRDPGWYPIDFRGKDQNVVGFTDDLLKAITQEEGFKAAYAEAGASVMLEGLDRGTYDGVYLTMTPTVVTKKKYAFSDPFYLLGPVVIVREESDIRSLQDLEGRIVGIENSVNQSFNITDYPSMVLIPYGSTINAMEKLDDRTVDAVIADALDAYAYTKGFFGGRLKVVTSPLNDYGLRLIGLNTPRAILLINHFNEGLKKIKEKGIYQKLLDKWQMVNTEKDQSEIIR